MLGLPPRWEACCTWTASSLTPIRHSIVNASGDIGPMITLPFTLLQRLMGKRSGCSASYARLSPDLPLYGPQTARSTSCLAPVYLASTCLLDRDWNFPPLSRCADPSPSTCALSKPAERLIDADCGDWLRAPGHVLDRAAAEVAEPAASDAAGCTLSDGSGETPARAPDMRSEGWDGAELVGRARDQDERLGVSPVSGSIRARSGIDQKVPPSRLSLVRRWMCHTPVG